MSKNIIQDKSLDFAIRVVNLYKYLIDEHKEYVLSKQVLRSGTAIGALVREAGEGETKADFIHKLSISLKEARETEYWIILLHRTDYIEDKAFDSLYQDLEELIKILVSILKTSRQN